jgi:hypothetical protein
MKSHDFSTNSSKKPRAAAFLCMPLETPENCTDGCNAIDGTTHITSHHMPRNYTASLTRAGTPPTQHARTYGRLQRLRQRRQRCNRVVVPRAALGHRRTVHRVRVRVDVDIILGDVGVDVRMHAGLVRATAYGAEA